MLNPELNLVFLPALCAMLFALGGTQITVDNRIGGWKGWRRFVLPAVLAIGCVLSHVIWWKALCVAIIAIVALSLGYGSKKPMWYKILVFSSYSLISMPIGIGLWNVLSPIIVTGMFIMSNKDYPFATWKVCEAIMGFLIGIMVGIQLM